MLIRHKLFSGFLTIAALVTLLGAVAFHSNTNLIEEVTSVMEHSIPEIEAGAGMSEALLQTECALRDVFEQRLVAPSEGAAVTSFVRGDDAVAELHSALDRFEARLRASYEATSKGVQLAGDEQEEVEDEKKELELLKQIRSEFGAYRDRCLNLLALADSDSVRGRQLLSDLKRHEKEGLGPLVDQYRNGPQKEVEEEMEEANLHLRESNSTLLVTVLLTIAGGLTLGWLLSRSILKPIGMLTTASQQMSRGNLDTRVSYHSTDELGDLANAFNSMVDDLRATTVSKSYVDGIITSMADMLMVLRPDHTIQSINRATQELLGFTETELGGKPFAQVARAALVTDRELLSDLHQKGFVRGVEASYLPKDGGSIPVSFSASVLRDKAGAALGVVCVAQDARERKRAEEQLERTHKELVQASHRAGMAEVATGVLHNVGNVLNSVNVSATLVSETLKKSKSTNLGKVSVLLKEHEADLATFLSKDPKGCRIPDYLAQLSEHLSKAEETVLQEIDQLRKNLEHIKEIVAMQQSYAKVSGVVETVNVADLVEDSLRMNSVALTRHQVSLERDFDSVPALAVEKHKVLQILVNLIRNAKYACDESERTDKKVTVRIRQSGDHVEVSVIDNGVGIPAENLTRIFNHGFTTRKDGHGFGLHSGALAAQELGGALMAQSAGPGGGASFTLRLPLVTNMNYDKLQP